MPAVYSGYAIYFGSEENMCDPEDTFLSWQMRQFTWGIMPGWFDRWDIGDSKFSRQQRVVARLARIRRVLADFMVYGRLEDEVRFVEAPPVREYRMNYLWRPSNWIDKVHMPDLHGTVWRSVEEEAVMVLIANASGRARCVKFKLPAKDLRLVEIPGTEGAIFSTTDGLGILDLPPYGIAVVMNTKSTKGAR